ncbi:MAG: M16 family metallopeptidase [Kiritimatiellia bacterium]
MHALRIAAICVLFSNSIFAQQENRAKLDILTRESALLTTFTLPNGLHVILKPDHAAPVATVQFWVGTGSMHEEQFTGAGVSHAVEHMLFKGTTNIPPGDLSRLIQEAGGRLNAYTTLDRTVYFADLPAQNWHIAFDLYAESLFHPAFPEEEWESERDVIMREIAMGQDNPRRVLIQHLWRTAVREATYRHPTIGYIDTFSKLTRDDLVTFHQRHYTPCNTTVIIVGDIDIPSVRAHVTATLEALPRPARAPVLLPVEPPQATPRTARFTAPHNITRLAQMWRAPEFPHPDAAALQVLAQIAGSGRTARLHRQLVEDDALLLGIGAWYFDRGFWGLSAQMEPAREADALTAIDREIEILRQATFRPDEVAQAVRSLITSTLQSFTTMSGQAAHYGFYHNLTGNPAADRILLEQIAAVTSEDVARVAHKWLQPHTRTRVVIAPGDDAAATPVAAVLPEPQDTKHIALPSGVTLLLRPNQRLPFVYIAIALEGGLLAENPDQAGITALMAELLTRGTTSRSRDEIAGIIESRGANLSSFSGFNAFGLTATGLSEDAPVLLDLVADILLNPAFPQDELDRQRVRQMAAIRQTMEDPVSQAMQQMRAMLFSGHPYAFLPNGTESTVATLTRDQIQAHHQRLATSSNLVIAVFGDIDPTQVENKLKIALQDITVGPAPTRPDTRPAAIPALLRDHKFDRRQQAILITGFPGLDMFDPDADAANLLQTALSGMSSALFQEIREKRGLAYFTSATQQTGLHPGFFALFAGTEPSALDQVEELMLAEITRIREQGITHAEFQRARAQLLAGHDMRLQNQLSTALDAALHERYGLGHAYPFAFPTRIEAITPEQIKRLAQRLFRAESRVTATLLPENDTSDTGTVDE